MIILEALRELLSKVARCVGSASGPGVVGGSFKLLGGVGSAW